MLDWIYLEKIEDLETVRGSSSDVPCIIFKHSIHCPISSIAKSRLEKNWKFEKSEVRAYFLDLITYRDISNEIVDLFQVEHASPQLLLIENGQCTWNTSHLEINVNKLATNLSKGAT